MKRSKSLQPVVLALAAILVLGLALPALAGADQKSASVGPGFGGQRAQTMVKALADLADKDLAAIQTERRAGKSIAGIAKEYGVSQEALLQKVTEQNQARLQTRLDQGLIDQKQYDSCLQNMSANIKQRMERTSVGNPDSHRGREAAQGWHGQRGANCGGCVGGAGWQK